MTEFGSLNHSPGKRVLNNLKTICFNLRFWKVVAQRVAVIKLRVDNIRDNGTGSSEVKIGADTMKFTNVIITRFSPPIQRISSTFARNCLNYHHNTKAEK